jgi:hypothetical protein
VTPYQRWRPAFAKALTGPLYNIDYLDYLVLGTGLAHVWPGIDAAIVTEFRYFPGQRGSDPALKAIHGLVAAGNLAGIRQLIRDAEAWGRQQGCSHAMIESRGGWQKILAADGWQPHQITLIKEL